MEPTDQQKRLLGDLLLRVLVEVRALCASSQAEQAAELADAFHNLPVYMFAEHFDWAICRRFIAAYQRKYPRMTGSYADYLALLDEIQGQPRAEA